MGLGGGVVLCVGLGAASKMALLAEQGAVMRVRFGFQDSEFSAQLFRVYGLGQVMVC